jgi:hypothetical protein
MEPRFFRESESGDWTSLGVDPNLSCNLDYTLIPYSETSYSSIHLGTGTLEFSSTRMTYHPQHHFSPSQELVAGNATALVPLPHNGPSSQQQPL